MLRSNQPSYVRARAERALIRRKRDITVVYGTILADKDAPDDVRKEAQHKHDIAKKEVENLQKKLTIQV